MSPLRFLLACVVIGVVSGCGAGPPPPPDPAVYARRIKQVVGEFVEEGARNPAAAPKEAAVLLESLEGYKTQAVGSHEAIYAALTERCRELSAAKGTADVRKKLDEMAALIKKLPD
jgi:hypothetical protein